MANIDVDLVLRVALIVVAVAAIWLLIELAVTVRKARPAIQEATEAVTKAKIVVDDLAQQMQPVIEHADELIVGAQPLLGEAAPVLEKTTQAVDSLNADLVRVEAILADASSITGAASNVTVSASAAAGALVGKVRDRLAPNRAAPAIPSVSVDESATVEAGVVQTLPDYQGEMASGPDADLAERLSDSGPTSAREPVASSGYFTYPQQ